MNGTALIQLLSACVGIIGSIFFAIGVMRQSVEAMGLLSGTYWDWNPHMPPALAQQKADYLFGGGLILGAFCLQLISFAVTPDMLLSPQQAKYAPWVAAIGTAVAFYVLRWASRKLAARFESEVTAWLKRKAKASGSAA
jgi:hypothetical protein